MYRAARLMLVFVAGSSLLTANHSTSRAADTADSTPPTLARTPEEAREHLQRLVDVDMHEIPLEEVHQRLEQIIGITVNIARKAAAAGRAAPVNFRVRQMPVQDVLDLMLGPIGWYWSLKSATLCIASDPRDAGVLSTEVYDVYDLVYTGVDARNSAYNFDGLIEVITSLVEPASWSEVGGAGGIKQYVCNGRAAIVVSQTWEGHRKIVDLLARLRALPKPAETSKGSEAAPVPPPVQKADADNADVQQAPNWWAVLESQARAEWHAARPFQVDASTKPEFKLLAWCVVDADGILTLKAIVWSHLGNRVWQLAQYVCLPLESHESGKAAWRRSDGPKPLAIPSMAANSFIIMQTYERPPANRDVNNYLSDLSEPWSFTDREHYHLVAGEVRAQAWLLAIGEKPPREFTADLPRRFAIPTLDADTLSRESTAARIDGLMAETGKMTQQIRGLSETLDRLRHELG